MENVTSVVCNGSVLVLRLQMGGIGTSDILVSLGLFSADPASIGTVVSFMLEQLR